ncbi:hypothetical protein AB0L41_47915 [Amycolatopsis mediterranei]|uniref:hypothetical protein n=1 Tax=Amycolatopsis mediterranei TaxID=33910 RepID=UPI00343CFE19
MTAYPRDQRDALVVGEPEKFLLPPPADLRYQWVCCRLAAIEPEEMRELVLDAWRMCVPKKVWTEYARTHPDLSGR